MPRQSEPSLFASQNVPDDCASEAIEAVPASSSSTPLAERMRPRSVDELAGQSRVLTAGSFLGRMLRGGKPSSCLLWGPPGSGKTTIARLLAAREGYAFEQISAVLSGVKEVREVIARARLRRRGEDKGTLLFVDEIHRFNKAQQDAFLPHVEAGTIVLIGATTENPSFEIIAPLLSRCRVVVLESLDADTLRDLILRALSDSERGLGTSGTTIDERALRFLADRAHGDARIALGALETAAYLAQASGATGKAGPHITLELAEEGLQSKAIAYDKKGEQHYNVISAFIKTMRAGDTNAALYWLARMLEAGEDPLFIARRMVVFASEDVGLADPHALPLATAVKDAVCFVGLPEARINLAHGVAYLASAPKSKSAYTGLEAAAAEVRKSGARAVPKHLRNAPTRLMKDLGYGRRDASPLRYLPEGLGNETFFPDTSPSQRERASHDKSGKRRP